MWERVSEGVWERVSEGVRVGVVRILSLHTPTYVHMYVRMYVCRCVCILLCMLLVCDQLLAFGSVFSSHSSHYVWSAL